MYVSDECSSEEDCAVTRSQQSNSPQHKLQRMLHDDDEDDKTNQIISVCGKENQ
jgi:hypothetical protein